MLDVNHVVTLGIKHGFLNWVEHESPPTFFPNPIDCYLDDENGATATYDDVARLYNLLCSIYREFGIA